MAKFDNDDDLGLILSVIIPMVDRLGQAIESIKSWTQPQTYAREKFEVIVVTDGSEPQLEKNVMELLAPHDSIIRHPSTNEFELYDVGARRARAKMLFFTEAHCVGESTCLANILQFLAAHQDLIGATCHNNGSSASLFARMQKRSYQEGIGTWSQPDHWRKIMVHGFAIYRQHYLAEGGFEYEYGLFSEHLFAARLHSRGRRLGYAANAIVHHHNANNPAELSDLVRAFVYGECRYRSTLSSGGDDLYFGYAPEWSARESYRATVARSLCRAILQDPPVNLRGGGLSLAYWTHRHTLLRFGMTALFGPRWHILRSLVSLRLAQLRIWIWRFDFDRCYRAYRDYWEGKLVRHFRLEFVTEYLAASIPIWSEIYHYDLAKLEEERLVGFYAVERWQGRAFRWSAPTSLLQISLPRGLYDVTMEMLSIGLGEFPLQLRIFFDDYRISSFSMDSNSNSISFRIEASMFSANEAAHHLVLVCNPFCPWKFGSTDQRELGLALGAIHFSPGFHQQSQVSIRQETDCEMPA